MIIGNIKENSVNEIIYAMNRANEPSPINDNKDHLNAGAGNGARQKRCLMQK
jgi:hypothetical protein